MGDCWLSPLRLNVLNVGNWNLSLGVCFHLNKLRWKIEMELALQRTPSDLWFWWDQENSNHYVWQILIFGVWVWPWVEHIVNFKTFSSLSFICKYKSEWILSCMFCLLLENGTRGSLELQTTILTVQRLWKKASWSVLLSRQVLWLERERLARANGQNGSEMKPDTLSTVYHKCWRCFAITGAFSNKNIFFLSFKPLSTWLKEISCHCRWKLFLISALCEFRRNMQWPRTDLFTLEIIRAKIKAAESSCPLSAHEQDLEQKGIHAWESQTIYISRKIIWHTATQCWPLLGLHQTWKSWLTSHSVGANHSCQSSQRLSIVQWLHPFFHFKF